MPKRTSIDIGHVSAATLIAVARARGLFVFDLETTGLNPRRDHIEGVAFYVPDGDPVPLADGEWTGPLRAWFPFIDKTVLVYVDDEGTGQPELTDLRPAMPQRRTMESLRPLFEESPSVIAVTHHGKFDLAFLQESPGTDTPIGLTCVWGDSMLADFLTDENDFQYGLKHRTKVRFDHDMTKYEQATKNRTQQLLPCMAGQEKALGIYAMEDCVWTWRLFQDAMERIRAHDLLDRSRSISKIENELGWRMNTLERIFWGIEMKVARILLEMETTGIRIDWRWLQKVTADLENDKDRILDRIQESLGFSLNPNSAPQVSAVLFGRPEQGGLGLPTNGIKRSAKTGDYATGKNEIGHLRRVHPVVQEILDYRSKDTLQGNYSIALARLVQDEPDSKIYSHFNQTGTKIGRLSSSNPVNLQSQPRKRNLIRKAFCAYLEDDPDPELVMLGADYGQIQLRVAAHLSCDPGMMEVYCTGKPCTRGPDEGPCDRYTKWICESKLPDGSYCEHLWTPATVKPDRCPNCDGEHIEHQARCRHVDLHQRTAEDVGVPRNPLAKNLNFGSLFRIGASRFCQYADLYDKQGNARIDYAHAILGAWYDTYPQIQAVLHAETERMLRDNGWKVCTIGGRWRHLQKERYRNEYRAITQGIQHRVAGSEQDILKLAMIRIFEEKQRLVANSRPAARKLWRQFKFVSQVHDEIICVGPRLLQEECRALIEDKMENAAVLRVPLVADVKVGRCWDDCH